MSQPLPLALPYAALPAASRGPAATDLPSGVDVDAIVADVADDGVSAPAADVDGLVAVVQRAEQDGIPLSIVVTDAPVDHDSQLRDLATEVGSEGGGTVLVLGSGQVGSFSNTISRVDLEAGQDRTYTSDPVVAANNFLDEITDAGPPWTAITVVLILLVAAVAGATAAVNARRSRRGTGETAPDETAPDQTAPDETAPRA